MRALAFAYPEDPSIWNQMYELQYCFGRDLLVSPIYSGHSKAWSLYLPAGGWRNFWTGEPYFGGQEITLQVTVEDIPVFVRAGAIIPFLDPSPDTLLPVMDEPEIKVAGNDLRLQLYPGADGKFDLYEGTNFIWQESSTTLVIKNQPIDRWVSIRVMDIGYRFVQAVDDTGTVIDTETTDLNGSAGHIRLRTSKDYSYSLMFL